MRDSIPFQTKMRTASQRNHVPLQTESRPASSGITGPLRPEYAVVELIMETVRINIGFRTGGTLFVRGDVD